MKDITFTMIKPDAIRQKNTGKILDDILSNGYKIIAMKYLKLSLSDAQKFYSIHAQRPFFQELTTFMSSGTIVAAILKKENAVEDFRTLIGATNPSEAEENTIRRKYATSLGENAIHGSDSNENAVIESNFFFSNFERFENG